MNAPLSAPGGFETRHTRIHCVALAAGDRDRHVHELRLDGRTRTNLLQAVDDKPLPRLQALFDDAQPLAERPDSDRTRSHPISFVDDIENFLPLIAVDSTVDYQESLM